MLLENDIIKLRALEPEDLDILYKWENDTSLWIHGNSTSPYSKLALRQYISDSISQDVYQNKQLRLMITQKDTFETIGTIDLYEFDIHNKRAGIGILLDEKFRGHNFAFESLNLIKEYCFNFFHLNQIFAYISAENKKSIKLFEKVGFKESGLLSKWIHGDNGYMNVYIYQLINE